MVRAAAKTTRGKLTANCSSLWIGIHPRFIIISEIGQFFDEPLACLLQSATQFRLSKFFKLK